MAEKEGLTALATLVAEHNVRVLSVGYRRTRAGVPQCDLDVRMGAKHGKFSGWGATADEALAEAVEAVRTRWGVG